MSQCLVSSLSVLEITTILLLKHFHMFTNTYVAVRVQVQLVNQVVFGMSFTFLRQIFKFTKFIFLSPKQEDDEDRNRNFPVFSSSNPPSIQRQLTGGSNFSSGNQMMHPSQVFSGTPSLYSPFPSTPRTPATPGSNEAAGIIPQLQWVLLSSFLEIDLLHIANSSVNCLFYQSSLRHTHFLFQVLLFILKLFNNYKYSSSVRQNDATRL